MTEQVTVLMAVYNDAPFLRVAIDSILEQTASGFRFLIVDDASTDESRQIIRSYRDPRIELLALERNVGQTAALNIGLRATSSAWIARMDADDYSAPHRLEEQMRVLRSDSSLRCLGTGIWEFREDPHVQEIVKTRPESHEQIVEAAMRGSGMIHGTLVIHRESLLEIGGYDERYRYASDRDMVIRFLRRFRAMNIPDPLLGVRRSPKQDSFTQKAAEEYIEIFQGLLTENGASGSERNILRASLAYSYLLRSRCLKERGRYDEWLTDQIRALRISPATGLKNVLAAVSDRVLPRRWRMLLRKDFVR